VSTIYPTHTCFDDALELLERAIKGNPGAAQSDELKVVHAICVNPWGEDYAHAWVESNGTHCWWVGILNGKRHDMVAERAEFYTELRVKETTKYTPIQAVSLNHQYGTYGPWEPRYLDLCNNGVKKRWLNPN
jgi:hypothetical protein